MRLNPLESDSLAGVATLGASGLASAGALVLLASNRLPGLDAAQVTPMLLAIQWHIVGLTLAKFGIDYALFAIVSRRRDTTFRISSALRFPVLPCLAAFAAASLALFTPIQVALISCAVLADTLATFRQSEFNAKRAFGTGAVGSLLNYPLFVLAWWLLARDGTSLTEALAAFAATSLLRLGWFSIRYRAISGGSTPVDLSVKGLIGAQGALNMLLFRFDQVALAVLLFAGAYMLARDPMLPAYLFLARIPEFATGILVLVGTVYFPMRHLEPSPAAQPALRFYAMIVAAATLAAAVAAAILVPAFAGPKPTLALCAPFILQIPLILLANLATYSMQSQSFLVGLIRNLGISCVLGLAMVAMAASTGSLLLLAWVTPVQLVLFFALSLFSPWGRPIAVFEEAPGT